jgi:hypothetical protein
MHRSASVPKINAKRTGFGFGYPAL